MALRLPPSHLPPSHRLSPFPLSPHSPQANWLRAQGVRKGDAVTVYLPQTCELPIAMLACARIGAVHRWESAATCAASTKRS